MLRLQSERLIPFIFDILRQEGIRVELDTSDETLGKKVRNAKTEKVPYIAVIGDKEVADGSVTLEGRDSSEKTAVSFDALVKKLKEEITAKKHS